MALTWKLKKVTIFTDSVTEFHWVSDALTGKSRLKSKAMGEMLIRRRLSVLQQCIEEYDNNVNIKLVLSKDNLADALTRVRSRWLNKLMEAKHSSNFVGAVFAEAESISSIHKRTGHFGVSRTLNFVRKVILTATKNDVLERNALWRQYQVHTEVLPLLEYSGERGAPSEILTDNKATFKTEELSSFLDFTQILCLIFCERGAPSEILTDNEATFKTEELSSFLDGWGVRIRFRAAYYPEGKRVVERNHRTIKRIAERSKMSLLEAVYWYEVSANKNNANPMEKIYRYRSNAKGLRKDNIPIKADTNEVFKMGENVWLKPLNAKCHTKWQPAKLTGNISKQDVEVNGVPRHVKHIRYRNNI
nr:uncharacterized protein LOC101238768 [Hydra vulgaris]